ncbi:hypothetical protein C4579_00060 [Candidatus Microgenomates bacterium]|nr:MAG: hypothetical protein C4579_00060 [Candidatus Microgenomates bacterium]
MTQTARRTPYLLFSLAMLAVIAVASVSVTAVQQRQSIDSAAKGRPANPGGKNAEVALAFATQDTFQVGKHVQVDVVMANSVPVAAAELVVNFPSDVLRVVSVTPDSYLPNVLSGPKVGNGEIMLAAGSSVDAAAEGSGTIATITFEMIGQARGKTEISFGSATDVAGLGANPDVAFSTSNLRVR